MAFIKIPFPVGTEVYTKLGDGITKFKIDFYTIEADNKITAYDKCGIIQRKADEIYATKEEAINE